MAFKLITILCVLLFVFSLSKGDDKVKRLEGCTRGSNVEGLRDVKVYLSRYGYLDHVEENDDFDEALDVAVKDYQSFYHLDVTGTLDGPTISQMLKPRCGVPDKKSSHVHGRKLLHIVSHYQFFNNNPGWPKSNLTYAFGSNFPCNYEPPVDSAFNTWASESGYFTFARAPDFSSADLKVSWESGDHGDGYPFVDNVLAHAFTPTDGRFHYNANHNWSIGATPNAFDVEAVALHEIGHLLGLDHSQVEKAIMWSSIGAGEVKGLDSDDIEGIRDLYDVNK